MVMERSGDVRRPGRQGAMTSMKSVVIGDIHGCAAEFEMLLDRVLARAGSARIRVRLVGDLLTKGPDPAGVVRAIAHFRRLGLDLHSVCGNHDLRLYAAMTRVRGGVPIARLARLERETVMRLDEADALDDAMTLLAETVDRVTSTAGTATVLHAGIRPGLGLAGTSQHDLVHLKAHDGERPWWDEYDGSDGLLIVGHKPIGEPMRIMRNGDPIVVNVDTGCASGGRLTAYVVEDDAFVSIEARRPSRTKPAVTVEAIAVSTPRPTRVAI
jgi:serine/threonine protein phosphatase 1